MLGLEGFGFRCFGFRGLGFRVFSYSKGPRTQVMGLGSYLDPWTLRIRL